MIAAPAKLYTRMIGKSALSDFDPLQVLHLRRMSAMWAATAASINWIGCRLWAVHEDGPAKLDFDSFCDGQRVLKLNAKIPHGAVHFGVTEQ